MPAYVVAMLGIHDPDAFGVYAGAVGAVTEKYGGHYLFAGPGSTVLEGEPAPNGMAIIEFPSADDARRWYESEDYAPLIELRQAAASTVLVMTPDRDAPS
jgi:uncharacterized protein (DUF1330 family)